MLSETTEFVPCIGCGGLVPAVDGPTHRYMESSPGCWASMARSCPGVFGSGLCHTASPNGRSAFAVQHPGRPSPQSIQSVGVHLVRLCLILERGFSDAAAGDAMPTIARRKSEFRWLTPPASMGPVTAIDVWNAKSAKEHLEAVSAWAQSAWQAWVLHHEQVRRWIPREFRS